MYLKLKYLIFLRNNFLIKNNIYIDLLVRVHKH